jgi:CRP-like cAMP-binding protein
MDKTNKKKLEAYFEKTRLKKYNKRELLFRPGDELRDICYIKSGYVRVYSVTKDGQEVTLQLFKPVFYLSLIQAINKFSNHFFFEAVTPVEMWVANREETLSFINKDKELSDQINKEIMGEFMELIGNIEYLISGNAYMKVARVIHNLVTKYGEVKGKEMVVKFGTPHRMIASMTGLTRETVTLQILKMEKNKLLVNKGKLIYVKNMDKLADAAMI